MLARPHAPVVIAAVAVTSLLGGVARAQPAPAPAKPAPEKPRPEPRTPEATVPDDLVLPDVIQPPPGFERDPAWSEYDGAFRNAAAGDLDAARNRLVELQARWPQHPARSRAEALARRLESGDGRIRGANNVARGEFVFWTTLGGISLAANLCVAIDCTTDREHAGVYTLTVGGAIAGSLFATRRGIRQGEAQLYNSTQTWAAWNALLVNDGFPETTEEAGVAIAMQLGGLAAGVGLYQLWRPTQGDVALTNTFLLWGTVLTVWGSLAADSEPSLRTLIIAGDISLVAGALISSQVKMSRGRTLLIDVGGILGMLGGGLIATGTNDEEGAGLAMIIGTSLGLGIAALATTKWDKPAPVQVAPAVIPGPNQSTAYGVTAGLIW